MKIKTRTSPLIVSISSVAYLAACATPNPGQNAGASVAKPVTIVNKPTLGQEVTAVANNKVEIKFPTSGATLTADADRQLDLAARLFRDANPVVMFATGYTDRSGDEYSNLLLSANRAEAVKRGLVARGVPADRLLIQALGASELANAADPLGAENRRVVISWRLL